MNLNGTIDYYAQESTFYELDARVKIIGLLGFIIAVALLQNIELVLISLFYIGCIIAISRVPPMHIINRYLFTLPFIIFAVLAIYLSKGIMVAGAMEQALTMFIRISTCVLTLVLLSTTTNFLNLLNGLQKLKLPRLFVNLLMFTYRYIFVFIDELTRMRLARVARGFHAGKHLLDRHTMRTIAYTAGMLLVKAYERGNKIYDALVARGYDGSIKPLTAQRIKNIDYVFCISLIIMAIYLIYIDWQINMLIL